MPTYKPWIRVAKFSAKPPEIIAIIECLVCNTWNQPKSRNGMAKVLRRHWSCGFDPRLE